MVMIVGHGVREDGSDEIAVVEKQRKTDQLLLQAP
jgi:hypothetical protein